jgi:uncharacterized protein (UPF0335 family)
MLMDNKKLSEVIRMKKKKMMMAEPELVDTDANVDMNPIDAMQVEDYGAIERTLNSPEKINADKTAIMQDYDGVGLSPEELKRMPRLRKYMDSMELSGT